MQERGLRIWRGIEHRVESQGTEARGQRSEVGARMAVHGHYASPSLGHYATLSFIVRGSGPEDFGFRIAN
jgi:hypothetical protein